MEPAETICKKYVDIHAQNAQTSRHRKRTSMCTQWTADLLPLQERSVFEMATPMAADTVRLKTIPEADGRSVFCALPSLACKRSSATQDRR